MFRQASSNRCERVLQAAKVAYAYANKTKESITSKKLGSGTFGELLIVFSTKANLLYLFYSTARRCCLFASSRNSNLVDSGISLQASPSRPILKLYNISVTPEMVKKAITNLTHQRRLVLIVFQWWFYRTVSLNFHTY